MDVPHGIQGAPGQVALGAAMRPVEQVLLGQPVALAAVVNVEERHVVGEHGERGLEDDEAAVEVVGAELKFIFFFRGREFVVEFW